MPAHADMSASEIQTAAVQLVNDLLQETQAHVKQSIALSQWDESKHKRGQPGNAGQFGSGGAPAAAAGKPTVSAQQPATPPVAPKPAQHSAPKPGAGGAAPVKSLFAEHELALPKDAMQPIAPNAGYAGLVEQGKVATHQLQELLDLGKGVGAQLGYETVQPKSDQEMMDLCNRPGGFVVLAPVKGEKRSTEKVRSDYATEKNPEGDWSKLIDIARASIVVDTFEDVEKAVLKLRENGTQFARKPKDRMTTRIPPGYRDCLTNVRLPNGIVGELQILTKSMMLAKVAGHKDYEITRAIDAKLKTEGRTIRTAEEEAAHKGANDRMAVLYDAAWAKCKGPP